MNLAALLAQLPTQAVEGASDIDVTGVTCDSRTTRPGNVFVAIPGSAGDGVAYVNDAVDRGAIAVVAERDVRPKGRAAFVRVADAHEALAGLACAFHAHPSRRMRVAGVTGTNGKTTTTYMMREAFRAHGWAPGLVGTVEYQIGERVIPATRTTPDAPALQGMLAQMLGAGCGSAVMEVSSHSLVQKRVHGIEFDVAVFTNLTRDHLDYHETMENYFEAKRLLFSGLGKGTKSAFAVINTDDPWGVRLAAMHHGGAVRQVLYGLQGSPDVTARDLVVDRTGSRFRLCSPWGETDIHLQLLGRYNVSNALAAAAACGSLGLPLKTIASAVSGLTAVPGRVEEIRNNRGFQVFVDYAHTDDALDHVLKTLRDICAGRLIVVFGCGGNRDRTKRPRMGAVATARADHTILTSDNPRKEPPDRIIAEIRAGCAPGASCEVVEDRTAAIRRAVDVARPGDVVLIAGKGHESYQELANTTIPFDDRETVRKCL